MHFNQKKTGITSDIIKASIKPDKLYWTSKIIKVKSHFLNGNGEYSQNEDYQYNLQKHLWLIKDLSDKYSNSGSVVTALSDYFTRIKHSPTNKNYVPQIISIIADLIITSPKAIPQEVAILSYIFSKISDKKKVEEYIASIMNKVRRKPNTEYVELWLQRLSILTDQGYNKFNGKLATKVNKTNEKIWNSSWCTVHFDEDKLINIEKLKKLNYIVPEEQVLLFNKHYNS